MGDKLAINNTLTGSVIKKVDKTFGLEEYYEVTAVTTKGNIVVYFLAYKSTYEPNLLIPFIGRDTVEHIAQMKDFEYVTLEEINSLAEHFPHISNSKHISHT